ncbi:hypothetical protein B0H63DRAFT_141610 [Podospora didyma]|uniref:DOMON domain-containing protein n=1 Tax=Podospora didyma TaxID=330526 RepID=A0AAE0U183_9PEZI|nr:hypothetical protein B0H63DRAFT_141610 [Podospora didyma]
MASGLSAALLLLALLITSPLLAVAKHVQYCRFGYSNGAADFCMAATNYQNATSATHDLYLTLTVTRSSFAGWTAIGTGPQMGGSLMFIVYGDPTSGRDPILSIRTVEGHHQPKPIDPANTGGASIRILKSKWELLNSPPRAAREITRRHDDSEHPHVAPQGPATHVARIAVVCYSCNLWRGSSISASSTSQPWIWAWNDWQQVFPGGDLNARLNMHRHSSHDGGWGKFYVDMTAAVKTSSDNLIPTLAPGVERLGTSDEPLGAGGYITSLWERPLKMAHWFIMGTAFLVLFPLGVMLMRTSSGNPFQRHWIVQLAATGLAWTGAVVGLAMTQFRLPHTLHQWVGIIIVLGLGVQAVLGWRHHVVFLQLRRRTWISHVHIWLGRSAVLAGWLNVIAGLLLSGQNTFNVVCAAIVIALESVIVSVWVYMKGRTAAKGGDQQTEAHSLMPKGEGGVNEYFALELDDLSSDDDADDIGDVKHEMQRLRRESDDEGTPRRNVDPSVVKS